MPAGLGFTGFTGGASAYQKLVNMEIVRVEAHERGGIPGCESCEKSLDQLRAGSDAYNAHKAVYEEILHRQTTNLPRDKVVYYDQAVLRQYADPDDYVPSALVLGSEDFTKDVIDTMARRRSNKWRDSSPFASIISRRRKLRLYEQSMEDKYAQWDRWGQEGSAREAQRRAAAQAA